MNQVAAILCLSALLLGCEHGEPDAVSGTISLAPALVSGLGESDTLFIIARAAKEPKGPPLAVKRIIGMRFPVPFSFTQADVLMPGKYFKGNVLISARVKKSGFVGIDAPGDLAGAYPRAVAVGAQNVNFTIAGPDKAHTGF
jgi:hypothetical protein